MHAMTARPFATLQLSAGVRCMQVSKWRVGEALTDRLLWGPADRRIWEQIWEHNAAKPPRINATRWNRLGIRPLLTSVCETTWTQENPWCVAHHREVAGANPVPATSRNGPPEFGGFKAASSRR
jgi:hypothetical protein